MSKCMQHTTRRTRVWRSRRWCTGGAQGGEWDGVYRHGHSTARLWQWRDQRSHHSCITNTQRVP